MLKLNVSRVGALALTAVWLVNCGGTTTGGGGGTGGQGGAGGQNNPDGGGTGGSGGPGTGGTGNPGTGGGNPGTGGSGFGGGILTPVPPDGVVPSTVAACATATDPGAFTLSSVPTWRDNATAAYVMIHDDMCGGALRGIDGLAVPAMAMRGLAAGLGPYVEACQEGNIWGILTDAENKGNEIINHSYTHPNITMANAAHEVTESKMLFDSKVKNKLSFFIFPFDFFTPDTIKAVSDAGHIGARAGSRDPFDGFENLPLNPALATPTGPGADLEMVFDVWPRTYSKYALYRPGDVLDIHVWNAIDAFENPPMIGTTLAPKRQVFAVREMHSVSPLADPPQDGSQGFGPVPIKVYEEHLDFLVAAWKANKVWTTTPSTVIKYRHARTACTATVSGTMLTFNASSAECTKYATPISVIVKSAKDVPGLSAVQGGKPVSVRKLAASTFSVTADPTAGAVTLGGCMAASVGVDVTPLAKYKKPTPANSVCDIQQVKGKGSPGLMDNLERTMEMLELLPNPAQGDGRDGSWSWYPGSATVEIVKDPTTTNVLRFAGKALNAYAGVTLAFLGGNGAGACYDATAYKGVRFRIKGHDTATDVYNGNIYLSLVTAETQTRKYGGDHKGDSGHFHVPVPVTADWQTVSVMWSQFMPPTFGDPPLATALALTKLQALDFGVSMASSDFEIFLDDIELF